MDAEADLSDIGSFLSGLSSDITSAYKTFNSPSGVPVPGSQVPGRPGYVYGPGGSIQAVNPATGGLLPPINSAVTGGTSLGTIALIAGLFALGAAFLISLRPSR